MKGVRAISDFLALFWILVSGVLVGFAFDWYRTFRRWRRWGPVLTFAGDIFFSVLALAILAVSLQRANFLSFRIYAFVGVLVGLSLYLRVFSHSVTRAALGSYRLLERINRLLIWGVKGGITVLSLLMRPFYGLLCWISMLFYRFGQAVILESAKSGRRRVGSWWELHFPPRTKG